MRLTKAQRYLASAFYELRRSKQLSEIKVIDLCHEADINHSTFYKYYKDIYDFNRQLEGYRFYAKIYYDARETQRFGIDFPIRFALFVLDNYPLYRKDEKNIFMSNLYHHSLESFHYILGKDESETKDQMPLLLSSLTSLAVYAMTRYSQGYTTLTVQDEEILNELWDNGILLLLKHSSNNSQETDNERITFFKKQIGERFQNSSKRKKN